MADAPPSPGGHGIAQPENGDHPPYLPDDTAEPYGEALVQLRDFLARGGRPDELPAFLAGLGFSGEREPSNREQMLWRALRGIQAEVTHKNGGLEARRGVSLAFIKRTADEALEAAVPLPGVTGEPGAE